VVLANGRKPRRPISVMPPSSPVRAFPGEPQHHRNKSRLWVIRDRVEPQQVKPCALYPRKRKFPNH
jgi:hypothetical protein